MIDHLIGRPSTSLKRLQVLAVLALWGSVLRARGRRRDGQAITSARSRLFRWADRKAARYSPWRVVLATLMATYALRHVDSIFGFGAPEPLAQMYSRSFYRVTWIVTALDAGFASAMNVKPKWLRDILSIVFSVYYVIYANEADEKLRKYRALCTVEMLRCTWEKTTNPYLRAATWFHRPSLPIARPILLPRPTVGAHVKRPIKAWLFYAEGKEAQLAQEEELYLDFPGGGFICMNPLHHEERLRQLAREVQRPILAIDYCKAPEYPYPFALEECFDVYRTLFETRGKAIGMSGSSRFRVILSGDSAGGNLATAVMLKILEYPQPHIKSAYATLAGGGRGSVPPPLPRPLSLILAYPSLNFSFTAWMKPEHLRVLKAQSEVNLESLQREVSVSNDSQAGRKGSPLRPRSRSRSRSRQTSLLGLSTLALSTSSDKPSRTLPVPKREPVRPITPRNYQSLASQADLHLEDRARLADAEPGSDDAVSPVPGDHPANEDQGWLADVPTASPSALAEADEVQRELAVSQQQADEEMSSRRKKAPVGTRLTMSSMSGYFQDRILTQSMMRAMAILYIGPRRQPDFEHDYLLSPVVAPARLLAEFPPVLFICGEKDPICDDTVIMAGRIREAKLAKQAEARRRRTSASSRFGEGLRMSTGRSLDAEADPIVDESVEDWVQMRIIASVSHGLLQMGALWPEAKHIISFIAAWTVEAFEDENERIEELQEERATEAEIRARAYSAAQQSRGPRSTAAATSSSPVAPLSVSAPNQGSQDAVVEDALQAGEDLAADDAALADVEDEDEPLSFTPKRLRSPSAQQLAASTFGATSPRQSPRDDLVPLMGSPRLPPSALPLGSTPFLRGDRSRPSSFSDVQRSRKTVATEAGLLPTEASLSAAPAAVRARLLSPTRARTTARRSSFAGPGASGGAAGSGGEVSDGGRGLGLGSSNRRTSRGPGGTQAGGVAAALDEKTKAILVNEGSLLQRRRQEAVSGLGSSAIHSDSEPDSDAGAAAAVDGSEPIRRGSRGRQPDVARRSVHSRKGNGVATIAAAAASSRD
ncbi:unnamed protein product [Parajaminaea phylloscopi]